MEEDDHTLLYRNIDAKVDPFSMHIEKHLMKLPDSLQFIKEYIYFDFLPKVDFWLDELEKIKTTTNYDENIAKIRPVAIRVPQNDITCLDLLGNHNIKHCKINRMLYGTSSGVVVVYDIEGDKCVVEKTIEDKSLGFVSCFLKLRDNNTILCGCESGQLCYYDLITEKYSISKNNHQKDINDLLLVNNKSFLSCSDDSLIKIMELLIL